MPETDKLAPIRLIIDNSEEVSPPGGRSDGDLGGSGGGGGGSTGAGAGVEDPSPFCSEDYLARQLSEQLGDKWRSTPDGRWWCWTGQRWQEERTLRMMAISRIVCRRISTGVENRKMQRDVTKKSTIYNAAALAATDRRHMTELERFDADAWQLNTPEGIVDLRNGKCDPHRPDALLTKMTAAGAAGDAPRFKAFLAEATNGDKALQSFLQRVAGYCLTGSIAEHAIFFLYDNGLGGTGKSTFVTVMSELLADYATVAPMDMFTVATGERHPTELAILFNVRLVTASETEEGRRWDEAKLKAITGGDPITARFMRGNFFTFRPMFKLLMSGNHRPRMRSADRAMRRRFHMIPFLHRPAAPDLQLMDKLRGEYAGILKWAIEGELDRRRIGLCPPPSVVAATDEYFENENALGRWIDERCTRGVELTALTRDLYRDFKSWAATAGEFAGSERVFSQKVQQQPGVERWLHPVTRRGGYRGIGLLAVPGELDLTPSRERTTPARGEGVPTSSGGYEEAGAWEADEQP